MAASPYVYGDVYGNPILPKAWDQLPEGYCRAYQGVDCTGGRRSGATSSAATSPGSPPASMGSPTWA